MKVANIYNTNIQPIYEDISIKQAVEIFLKKDYNSVLVLDNSNQLVGVLSLQDIASAIVPPEMKQNPALAQAMYKPGFFEETCQEIQGKKAKDLMRTMFIKVSPQTNVMEVAADFFANDLYIVPVLENEKLIGIVTRSDIRHAFALAMGLK